MALSMDEQRMLAEIERRLVAEDPGLASRLSSFRRPSPAARLRTTRGKIVGSIVTIVLLAIVGLTIYAMMSVRAKTTLSRQPGISPSTSATVATGPAARVPSTTSRPIP